MSMLAHSSRYGVLLGAGFIGKGVLNATMPSASACFVFDVGRFISSALQGFLYTD